MMVKELIAELKKYPQGANIHKINNIRIDSNGLVFLDHKITPEETAKSIRLQEMEYNKKVADIKSRQARGLYVSKQDINLLFGRYMDAKIKNIERSYLPYK